MPIFSYPPEVKAKIIEIVQAARANGSTWEDAFKLAQTEGYQGSAAGLYQFMRNTTLGESQPKAKGKKRGRKPSIAAAAPVSADTDVHSVQNMINAIVKQRVVAALAKVRATLDEAEKAL